PLGFVGPKNNEIILGTLAFGLVEAAQRVIVEQQLEEGIYVTALGLEFLRHCCQDDFALVDSPEIERAFLGAEYLGNFGREEVLKVVADGFAHTSKLFVRLGQETVCKVRVDGSPTRSFRKELKILHLFFEQVGVGQQLERSKQRNGAFQLEEHFERVGDVGLRLVFEKAFVAALAKAAGGVHDELGVGHEWDASVAGEVEAMRWRPVCVCIIRADLQVNQVVLAAVVPSHRGKGFPIDALFINAKAAPLRLVLKNLMCKLVNAGTGFARASVAGNEPAATKLITFPGQTAKSRNAGFPVARIEQQPGCDECQENAAGNQGESRIPQRQ